jgi:hypothetical protein
MKSNFIKREEGAQYHAEGEEKDKGPKESLGPEGVLLFRLLLFTPKAPQGDANSCESQEDGTESGITINLPKESFPPEGKADIGNIAIKIGGEEANQELGGVADGDDIVKREPPGTV